MAYDFGVKRNILRMLAERGVKLTVVPAQTPAADVLAMNPDGVFLSNARATRSLRLRHRRHPRVPRPWRADLRHLPRSPVAGLASGAKTLKMKFGHHGANHPVRISIPARC